MRRVRFGANIRVLSRRATYGGRKGRRARVRIAAMDRIVLGAVRLGGNVRAAIHRALGWAE